MLLTYFMVGIAFCIPELVIVNNNPKLGEYLGKHPIAEIVFSIMLGVVVGWAMGINGGVTFAVGNVFATMITKTIYSLKLLERWKKGREYLVAHQEQMKKNLILAGQAIRFWFRVFTAPIRFIIWAKNQVKMVASKASDIRAKLGLRAQRA